VNPDEFVRRHGPVIYNLALRLAGDAAGVAKKILDATNVLGGGVAG
jgi:hypothetical protein